MKRRRHFIVCNRLLKRYKVGVFGRCCTTTCRADTNCEFCCAYTVYQQRANSVTAGERTCPGGAERPKYSAVIATTWSDSNLSASCAAVGYRHIPCTHAHASGGESVSNHHGVGRGGWCVCSVARIGHSDQVRTSGCWRNKIVVSNALATCATCREG